MPPAPDAEQTAALKQRLAEMMAGADKQAVELPRLGEPKNPLSDYLDEAKRWLHDLIDSLFPKNVTAPWKDSSLDVIQSLLKNLPYILIGVVALVLLWFAIAAWRGTKARPVSKAAPPAAAPAPHHLASALSAALAGGRWGEALRLRWRLFLERRGLPASVTPREFQQKTAAPWSDTDLARQYGLMFGVAADGAAAFAACEALLAASEAGAS